ncbi:hypothetical protein CGGC5_v012933 [Colletotrichum fructicola Nara gc5]|uniref:Uncharacterized protein n=1 Tax=Colletotrichum fructicola (strain Nara gc5) TaxID=1213859 RepID=A0A7J6ISK9_COLFN|nr:hypothetical protein CGGC5_v012933 [Colletotrichum fructicola Nara gc5]
MLFSNFASAAVAVSALFVPAAFAQNEKAARAGDVTLKWHITKTCGGPGPARSYTRNECIELSDSSRAVKMLGRNGLCHRKSTAPSAYYYLLGPYADISVRFAVVSFSDRSCLRNAKTLGTVNKCYDLSGKGSVKIQC